MLQEFAIWYGGQMAALVPSLTARDNVVPNGLLVIAELDPSQVPAARFVVRRRGREVPLGRFVLDPPGLAAARAALNGRRLAPAFVRVPAGALLERSVTLPLAAESSLERVVNYELDRYTPFSADEVFWSAQVQRRDRAQGRLHATVTLVPKTALAPLLEALGSLGVAPVVLEGRVGAGADRRVRLAHTDGRAARRGKRLVMGAAVACAVLLLVAAGLPFFRQSQAASAVEARIAALEPGRHEAEDLRQTLVARAAGSDAIAAEQAALGDTLQTIAALTQILPDDTFLTALVLQKRQVTIEGQSANAARLIGSLSADPVIRNAAFAAPVTRNDTGSDLFSIKAEVRP